jgi:hypothetical protein
MVLSRKKATTIALDPEDDRRLSRAARERGVSRSEFIQRHRPRPHSDGSVIALAEGLGIRRLATRDVRHFATVRLRDGSQQRVGAGRPSNGSRHVLAAGEIQAGEPAERQRGACSAARKSAWAAL